MDGPCARDLHALSLHPQSLRALADHFASFPQTQRELEVAAQGSLDAAWEAEEEEDAGCAGDGGGGQGSGKKRARNGPPPLVMRPFTSITPAQAAAASAALADRVAGDPTLRGIHAARARLPVHAFRDAILSHVASHQVVLIAGATGCGKTTQVPQYLIDDAWARGTGAAIMCTQPRRISAITVGERVAVERGETIGEGSVGYQIRLESRASSECSLLFCTNGVLLRRLTSPGADRMLAALSHIVIDELHERDLFADFLTIALRSALGRHPHLRLVLMSATMREDLFSSYFGGCPVIRVPGYTHPVADYYLEDILPLVGYGSKGGAGRLRTATADPDSPEGVAVQAAVMRAFLEGTDDAFDALLDTVRGVGSGENTVGEQALVGVAHAATGATALMAAAGKGRHMEISQLLGCGADPTQKSRDGSTAADWARRFGHEDIAAMLDQAQLELDRLASMEGAAASLSQYQLEADPDEVDLSLAQELIYWIVSQRAGDMQTANGGPECAVLVFLPGWNEISQLRDMLAGDSRFGSDVLVLPLHSMVPPAEQKRVFQRPPRGVKKVVLATNIAETAVTIDDVVFVVDSGRLKEKSYDPHTGVSTLQSAWISRASGQQRRGRAGRVRPGECYRLYSTARFSSFADFQLPEMQRSPLEELCLQVRMLADAPRLGGEHGSGLATVGAGQGSTAAFLLQAVEPPIPQAITHAVTLLQDIGALKDDEGLTQLGRHLGEMPVHPRVGKMLLYATLLGVLDPVLTVACAAAYRSPFVMSMDGSQEAGKFARHAFSNEFGGASDHLAVVAAFAGWETARARGGAGGERQFNQRNSLSGATLNMLKGMRQQLARALSGRGLITNMHQASANAGAGSLVRAVLAVGMYPMIGRLLVPGAGQQTGGGAKAMLATLRGEKVRIHPSSINCKLHKDVCVEGDAGRARTPVLVCYDEATRGESLLYVRECTVVAAPALILVASSLTVEALPPVELPKHDPEDHAEAAEAAKLRDEAQAAQDASGDAVLVCDNWLKFRVPLPVLSQLACLRIRLAHAFAAKVQRPAAPLADNLTAALEAAATLLAHDGGAAGTIDRGRGLLGVGGAGGGGSGGFRRDGFGNPSGGRPGDWQCPRGCGVVFANKNKCFRCGAPKGGGGDGVGQGYQGQGIRGGGRGGGRARGGRGVPPPRVLGGGRGRVGGRGGGRGGGRN